MATDPDLLRVLHALRLVGFSETERIAARLGLATDAAIELLRHAERAELVVHRSGRMAGWSLTASGRTRGERLLGAQLDADDARDAVEAAYGRFVEVNQRFLDLCTDWQLLAGPPGERRINDHADPAYDAAVIARLAELHDVIVGVVADLAAALDRFAEYERRLGEARRRVEAGDLDWFTRPTLDSYHTVWFELHEDLLATLGLRRTDEH